MMQDVQQLANLVCVIPALCRADVIDDHPEDRFHAPNFMRQILRIGDCDHFGHMLMLGNREHFLLGEVTKSQAIIHTDHRLH